MADLKKVFAKNLKRLREKNELTQEELASILQINTRYVQRLESKNPPNVKIETIALLAKVLKAAPEEFFKK